MRMAAFNVIYDMKKEIVSQERKAFFMDDQLLIRE